MPVHLSFDDPTIIATYSARYDAEMAKGRLDAQGIRAVLASDDAGGAYPQMQRTQGVRLVVSGQDAHRAWHTLDDLNMLPPDAAGTGGTVVGDGSAVWRALGRGLMGIGGAVVIAAGIGWALSGSGVAIAVAGLGFALVIGGGLVQQHATDASLPRESRSEP
ncbi:MAG: hypothetical protein R6T83_05525 [Salinibacter sp.]